MSVTRSRPRAFALALCLLAAPLAAASPQAPSVPAPFRAALAAEAARGLKLETAREGAVAGGRYLAAILRYPETDPEKADFQALRLYYLADGAKAPEERARYDEQRVSLGTYEDEAAAFADVNRDGTTELVVTAANGGNCWNCSRVLVYALGADSARLLAASPMRLENVLGDEALELLVGDTRWEFYDDFSHAGSPGGTLVYAWRDGRYVFAGADAADFYKRAADALRAELPEAVAAIDASNPYSDEQYLGAALSLYLISAYTGQAERGREELRKALAEHAPSAEMRERRKRILADFLSGESAKALESPRRGEPLEVRDQGAGVRD